MQLVEMFMQHGKYLKISCVPGGFPGRGSKRPWCLMEGTPVSIFDADSMFQSLWKQKQHQQTKTDFIPNYHKLSIVLPYKNKQLFHAEEKNGGKMR